MKIRSSCITGCALATVLISLAPTTLLSQSDANLAGTWLAKEGLVTITLTLNTDGSGKLEEAFIKYVTRNNTLEINEEGNVNRYTYLLDNGKLTLSGGDLNKPMVFERQGAASPSGLGARRAQGSLSGGASTTPVGTWATPGPNGILRLIIKPDGSGTFNGGAVRWEFNKGVLTLTGPNGKPIVYEAAWTQTSLTLSGMNLDQPVVFQAETSGNSPSAASPSGEEKGRKGLVGKWQGPQGIVQINADGTLLIQGVPYRYTQQPNVLILVGNDGTLPMAYQLGENTLTVTINGQSATLTRIAPDAAGASAGAPTGGEAELAGKWCYFSSFSANAGGGSMTDECFVINAGGTYSYHREASMSAYAPGVYGGTASQNDDSGTFRLSGTTITVVSRTQGTSSYTLEKRNHPKTGDPMLCLDGRCYVTYYQHPPWR